MSRNLRVAALPLVGESVLLESTPPQRAEAHETGLRLGRALQQLGKLDEAQVEFVLEQLTHSPRGFGEVAVSLGLITAADLQQAQDRLDAVSFHPARGSRDGGLPAELATLEDATSLEGEALRALRSQLMLRWFGSAIEQHTLAIVSPGARDGRTHVCAALAVLIAQMEEDVLVLDADLRSPRLHTLFGIDNAGGLSAWLRAPTELPQVHGAPGYEHLHVLPAGPQVRNPNELLGRRKFGMLLESLARRYSYVLIDTPPAMQCAEALTIAVRASGCLLLTRRHRTRLGDAREVAGTLEKHGVAILGGVINDY